MNAPVQPGEVLEGKYVVERVLGMGGMGVVVAAFHMQLQQRVALKFLLPEASKRADVVARFAREARAAARIQSEHVARVVDVGTMSTGAPYMVMEYLDGWDFSRLLRQYGAMSIPDSVDYLLQACEAIAEAHVAGIVHRDLKPGNLFLARRTDGSSIVKVLDFGISKASTPGVDDMTQTSQLMGSPLYMSPEQLRSARTVDSRSDLWALGIILFQFVTGQVPFKGETMPELCAQILVNQAPLLRTVRSDAPEGLELAIQTCLQQDPTHRFANIADFANAIAPFGTPKAQNSSQKIARVVQGAGFSGVIPMASTGGGNTGVSSQNPSISGYSQATTNPQHVASLMSGSATGAQMGMSVPGRSDAYQQTGASMVSQPSTHAGSVITTNNSPPTLQSASSSKGLIMAVIALSSIVIVGIGGIGIYKWRSNQAKSAQAAATKEGDASLDHRVGPTAKKEPALQPSMGVGVAAPDSSATPTVKEAKIVLKIAAKPANAKIFLDDSDVGSNPYEVSLKKDPTGHHIRIEAAGYKTQKFFKVFDKEVVLNVELDRLPHGNNGNANNNTPGRNIY
jgi:serine/threonine protein kinase